MRRWVGTVASGLVVGSAAWGCGGGTSTVRSTTLGDGLELLEGRVPPSALLRLADAVHLLSGTCPDLPTDRRAAQATLVAAGTLGLDADDDRWGAVAGALTAGIATHPDGTACSDQMARWMRSGTTAATIPTTAPSTTTTPLDAQAQELFGGPAPRASAEAFRRIESGLTLTEVRALLGSRGKTISSEQVGSHRDERIRWPTTGSVFAAITVQFRDGRVLAATTTGDR